MKRLLFPLLFAAVALGAIPMTTKAASAGQPAATAKYVCLIVLDAGRPDYITNNLKSMPNMRQFLTHARWYDRAWVGSLMSITPPDHAVIGTGSFPKDDGGIVNWDWGIHSTGKISPTFQALASYQNGYAFSVIQNSGSPTLSGMIRKKYPKGLVIAGSGAHFHAAGPMGGPDASWIFYYDRVNGNWAPRTLGKNPVPAAILNDPSLRVKLPASNNSTLPLTYDPVVLGQQDSLVVSSAIRSLQLYRPRAIMINLPEPDTAGHWSSSWYPEERRLYLSFDKDLGRLVAAYKAAGIYNKTLFVITADHGMIQYNHRVLDRTAVQDQINSTLGQHSTILFNGGGKGGPSMTSIWLKNPANNQKMATAIYQHKYDNVSAVYYLTNTNGQYQYRLAGCESCSPNLIKAYNYLLSTEAGPTGEDIAILLRENTGNSGLPTMYGRHGGADWGSQHVTLIISGPGVKNGRSEHPARLVDLAPTIERFMGITPNARDGLVLADAFQNPNPVDTTRQNQSDVMQNVYVSAISGRAQSDISLEARGLIANEIPADEVIIHWKRRWAVTIAGAAIILGTGVGLAWAIAQVRRQGTGLQWVD
ncbi:MAG TPA: alkaline phosphatase family protein [Chloroflexota bacterium]|nr:alkaline phosphatase family protein [Chloroflexota bacterium]